MAKPNTSSVLINGKKVDFESYNIDGFNYFKLRDIALALKDTGKGFEVEWDGNKNSVSMKSYSSYTQVGGELSLPESYLNKQALVSTVLLYLDQQGINLNAYNIDGNNYFKLRDVARTFDFNVNWNQELQTISVDTLLGYESE
ncbi:hypothetical protein SDC9_124920 [bioreactor metagenome]|uniref:Copper amine oxidase-like N-terminal domain-containing protein n=2 Tax=root TaxID=1 RepID=A0A645CLT8_9ZZZZ